MTCGFRNCQSRACGSTVRPDGHELAYCVAHEAIARHLPTLRSARCCTSEGCGRPQGSRSPLCKSCRPRYSAWGLDGYPVPQEAPMTEPTPLSKLPELGFARIQVQTSGASLADLEAAVAKVTPPAPPATVEEFLRDLESGDGEPSEGDVADAPLFVGGTDSAPELVARWGQVHTAPPQPMSPDLDGLAALAARGQQPTAPGPTVAELQQQLAAERARADLLDAEAVSQRQRAEAVEAELFELDHTLHTLGAHGTGSTKEWLLQVLTPEDRRAILEFDVAEARMDLARLRARRLNPAPPEKLAEYAAKVAEVEAKIAALDR